jgi:hypothetical protein
LYKALQMYLTVLRLNPELYGLQPAMRLKWKVWTTEVKLSSYSLGMPTSLATGSACSSNSSFAGCRDDASWFSDLHMAWAIFLLHVLLCLLQLINAWVGPC